MPPLSNYLSDLAERIGESYRSGNAKTADAAADYLKTGKLLTEAKAACGHGQWLPLLERAGVPERRAQRMMRLAASGIDAKTLAETGIRATLEGMARTPKSDTVTDLNTPPPQSDPREDAAQTPVTPTQKQRAMRAARRAAGLCINCGEPSDGMQQCAECRRKRSERDARQRAEARTGKALAPPVREAAKGRRGIGADEVAALDKLIEDT